jgi:hypothetical protein
VGGGNAVACWMLQALREKYTVTLLTWEPVSWAALNRYYGTSLAATNFQEVAGLAPHGWVAGASAGPAHAGPSRSASCCSIIRW